ncbi:MAG: zinc ribbon domain-containing protein [Chloroflexota bacterium]
MALPPDPLKNLIGTGQTPAEWYTLLCRTGCLTWKARRERGAVLALLEREAAAYRPSHALGSRSLTEVLIGVLGRDGYLDQAGCRRLVDAVDLDGAIALAKQILAAPADTRPGVGWLRFIRDGVEHVVLKLTWRRPASIPAPAQREPPIAPGYGTGAGSADEPAERRGAITQPVGLKTLSIERDAQHHCSHCNQELPAAARFCGNCGHVLRRAAP